MKITTLLFIYIIIITACNTGKKDADNTPPSIDSLPVDTTVAVGKDNIILKEMILNEQTVFDKNKLTNAALISPALFKDFSVRDLDAVSEATFKYYSLDTLFAGKMTKILLIARIYREENVVWLAVYDGSNRLVNSKEVFYDNAEGFTAMTTSIKNNLITITTTNDFAETENKKSETTTWLFDKDNKLIQQP